MEWLTSPDIWIALITLSTLEIVLGVDNLVFVSIAVSRLPPDRRPRARRFGLALACITRIMLLLSLAYLARMDSALFTLFDQEFSIRDLVLIGGGLFLLVKGTMEIHDAVEGRSEDEDIETRPSAVFGYVIAQIAIIDIVFSLDSVITAIGMVPASQTGVMVAAIIIAVIVMIIAANPIGDFIENHPTIKMLALSFLILVGMALVADGFDAHMPRAYLYFAMAFSASVEFLNMLARRRHRRRQQAAALQHHPSQQ
ncbi:MAG: TerC family protein [Xanthomonadales bacterium]|nr:TerC family protein [Xanthomonadales bacterium]